MEVHTQPFKTRNRMISSKLSGMKRQGICCTQFTPTSNMLKRFNDNMYRDGCDDSDDCNILELTID